MKAQLSAPTKNGNGLACKRSGIRGAIIVNADDWGCDSDTTDRIFDCILRGVVCSTSAMVFMQDSERAAYIARNYELDAGLHLNFTTSFSGLHISPQLVEHQGRIARFLRRHRFYQALFHPGLTNSFEYVIARQQEEFFRLYGTEPYRIDGHHHMHLCANVLMGQLIPKGTIVRRSFSFSTGEEKNLANRYWRTIVNSMLARRYRLTDFFFSLQPLSTSRLRSILSLASRWIVEVETHPVNFGEYELLTSAEMSEWRDTVEFSSFSKYFN